MKSVGLLAYEIGSLQECNEELSKYGPENFKADRITVKLRPGQQTAPNRNNIIYIYLLFFMFRGSEQSSC